MRSTQLTFYIFNKIANHLAETLNVDRMGIERLKNMAKEERKTRIILLPIYKSYADAMIMHFISYLKDIEPSFIFGNYEEIPKVDFILKLSKGVGVCLIRRFPQYHLNNDLSGADIDAINYVNQSLLDEVVQGNKMTTFFQNDKRIRTGKFSLPNQAETSIKMILRTHAKL